MVPILRKTKKEDFCQQMKMKLNHKYRLIAGLKLLKKELETLFSIDLELKSSLVAKIFHRILVGILMLISIVFLGYNCIPDIPLQVTTDLDVKGQSDTGLDWKTLALIGGVVIGITCVGLAGYYLYHHPEIIPTVFRPWRWFSPKTDPKTDPKPDDEQNQDQNQNQDQDTATTTTTTDESDSTPEATWTEETTTTAPVVDQIQFSTKSVFYCKEHEFVDLYSNKRTIPEEYLEKICRKSIVHVLYTEATVPDLKAHVVSSGIKDKILERVSQELNEISNILRNPGLNSNMQLELFYRLEKILAKTDDDLYLATAFEEVEELYNMVYEAFPEMSPFLK